MRGLVRIATTVITTRWAAKLPAGHGHSFQLLSNTAATGAAANENQKAPTGRTNVSRTGSRARSVHTRVARPPPPLSVFAMAIANSPAAVTQACGVQAAYFRMPSGSRRVSGPSTRIRGSGR